MTSEQAYEPAWRASPRRPPACELFSEVVSWPWVPFAVAVPGRGRNRLRREGPGLYSGPSKVSSSHGFRFARPFNELAVSLTMPTAEEGVRFGANLANRSSGLISSTSTIPCHAASCHVSSSRRPAGTDFAFCSTLTNEDYAHPISLHTQSTEEPSHGRR